MGSLWVEVKPLVIAVAMFALAPIEARLLFAWFEAFGIAGDYTLTDMERRIGGMTNILRIVFGVAVVAIGISLLSGA